MWNLSKLYLLNSLWIERMNEIPQRQKKKKKKKKNSTSYGSKINKIDINVNNCIKFKNFIFI